MSLINQVLRDLDQRHAAAGGMPAAVKAPAMRAAPSLRRWRMAAVAMAAVLVVGGAASAITLSLVNRPVQAASVPVVAPVAAAPKVETHTTPVVVAAATDTTPVVVVQPAAAVAKANVVAPAPAATPAPMAAVAPPKVEAAASSPAAVVAAAAPAAVASSAKPVASGESRIEKKAPSRTAHERAEAEYQRGVSAHQQGALGDAASAYASALREESAHMPARQALSGLLIAQGRSDEARQLLSEGLARAPRHAGMAMMLSRLHAERGEWQRAIEALDSAPVSAPSAEELAFRAALLQRLNRNAEAAEHFSAALRTMPQHGVWWMGLGMSLAAEGRTDTAKEAFNRARASGSLTPELAQYVEQRLRQL